MFGDLPKAQSHQRVHVNHITEAKKSETRFRRAEKTVEALIG
jgi:uncharacterized protein YdeI (YjbR/CyaY-like superfamily)